MLTQIVGQSNRYCNYCQPYDIARRILRRKPYWYHGKPDIRLAGENNTRGELEFDFKNLIVTYSIFIKDRDKILDAAHMAIENIGEFNHFNTWI